MKTPQQQILIGLLLGLQIKFSNSKGKNCSINYKTAITNKKRAFIYYNLFKNLNSSSLKKSQIKLTKKHISFNLRANELFIKMKKDFYTCDNQLQITNVIDNYMSKYLIASLFIEVGFYRRSEDYSETIMYFDFKTHYTADNIIQLKESMERVCGLKSHISFYEEKEGLIVNLDLKEKESFEIIQRAVIALKEVFACNILDEIEEEE